MAAFVDQVTELLQRTDDAGIAGCLTTRFTIATPPRSRSDPARSLADHGRLALLSRVVETEVLPRLVRTRPATAPARPAAVQPADDTTELVRLALSNDTACAVAFVERLQAHGANPEALFLGVLTAAARRLGELWMADRADFVQVTLATGVLQQLLRVLAPAFQAAGPIWADFRSVLLIAAPGEQHTFGLSMLGQFFRRAGWHVAGGPGRAATEVLDAVRGNWIDVAAFSIGSVALIEGLALLIRQVRRASRNPGLCVMVGGPLYLTMPELARRVGADAAAMDAPASVRLASDMLAVRVAAE